MEVQSTCGTGLDGGFSNFVQHVEHGGCIQRRHAMQIILDGLSTRVKDAGRTTSHQ